MLLNAVKHMKKCQAIGTVIVPEWPSAPFWPILSPNFGSFKVFIIDHVVLPNSSDLCIPGRGQCLAYKPDKRMFQGALPFRLLALRFDFTSDHP
jgi:hypothetical protein